MHTTPEPQGNLPPTGQPGQQPPNGQPKTRRQFGDDQKATLVRRHLADKVAVGDLADEYRI